MSSPPLSTSIAVSTIQDHELRTSGWRQRPFVWMCLVTLLSLLPVEAWGAPPAWQHHGTVAEGLQFDVVRGPSDVLHLVSSRYYQFDGQAVPLVDENQGDGRQGALDFPPAIAVGDDGSVHLVTRHGGDYASGHNIRYRRRTAAGVWDLSYVVAPPVKRNYAVGVAWSAGHVYLAHSDASANFWGRIRLFEELGGTVSLLGDLHGIWRADHGLRMRGHQGRVHLASGVPDPGAGGRVFLLSGQAGSSLVSALVNGQVLHSAGGDRKGAPDLFVDGSGAVHLSYGARFTAHYNQYSATGQRVLPNDALLMSSLGLWQLDYGLSAVATGDSGGIVVVVALRSNSPDPDNLAEDCSLFWSYSIDGGQSFSAPAEIGRTSNGGVGRLRPRLTAIGRKFFLFYKDNGLPGVSLATLEFESPSFSDFEPVEETADPTPDCSIKIRSEFSGLDVSSAVCEYSSNGGDDWSTWPASCTGSDGTTVQETISSAAVPFLQEASAQNQIRFRVTSIWGETFLSPVHPVPIAESEEVPDAGPDDEGSGGAGDGVWGGGGADDGAWGGGGGLDGPSADGASALRGECTCRVLPTSSAPTPRSALLLLLAALLPLPLRRAGRPPATSKPR